MIGIIILNYNNYNVTIQCINSIFNCETKDYIIYVIDNGSTVKSPKIFEDLMTDKRIVPLIIEKNIGYASGNNVGIKKAIEDGCDLLLITNSDIEFYRDSIENLKKYYVKYSGFSYPKVLDLDGKCSEITQNYDKSFFEVAIRTTLLKFVLYKRYKELLVSNISESVDKYTFTHCYNGSCFMIDSRSIQKIGFLDENTFLYFEEFVNSYNADKNNVKICFVPFSTVLHKHGQSTNKKSTFVTACYFQSAIYYLRNFINASRLKCFPLLIYYIIHICIKSIFVNNDVKELNSYIKRVKSFF